jgi:hypothetical protein
MRRVGTWSLAVTDFWGNHVPSADPIVQAFAREGFGLADDVRRSSVTVASVFGRDHWKSRGRVVIFSGEAYFRDRFADFSIDCRFLGRSNHLRLPLWAYNALGSQQPDLPQVEVVAPTRFCNFIYSNPRSEMRNAFFELLNAKRAVDSLGSLMNNRVESRLSGQNDEDWHSTKAAVLSDYRFTIAFENTELPGYTTEKMIDAWMAGSVPIYWGNPAFTVDFPPDSCLSLYEAGSLSKLVDQVLEAENEPERYAQLQAANPFRTGVADRALRRYQLNLEEFAGVVVEDAPSTSRRRIGGTLARVSENTRVATGKVVNLIEGN